MVNQPGHRRGRDPRPRGPKMLRRSFSMDAATASRLRERARRHGVSQAEYVRTLINGTRPGATPGSEVALADSWWDSRKPARRVSIHQYHATGAEKAAEPADQSTIFDLHETHHTEGDTR